MEWRNSRRISANTRHYTNQDGAVRGLLGGIGTGTVSLDAGGRLCDFEWFGHPDKGLKLPFCFYALRYKAQDGREDARILEALPPRQYRKPLYPSGELMGLPRFEASDFSCRYPFYFIEFFQPGMPLSVRLEAYTPFIPLDPASSSLPMYRMRYTVENRSEVPVQVSIAGSLFHAGGFQRFDGFDHLEQNGNRHSYICNHRDLHGVLMDVDGLNVDDTSLGSLAIACEGENVSMKPHWQFGGWWDGAEEFWQDFILDGQLEPCTKGRKEPVPEERFVASVAQQKCVLPGEQETFTFYTSWRFPNRLGWWPDGHMRQDQFPQHNRVWHNHYAIQTVNAWQVLTDYKAKEAYLADHSRLFSDALYSSTLGVDVIEELVASITVLRSTTCFQIEDGTFFGWEGGFEHAGSCAGNCTHVWNYAQTLAFLFPTLEQSMRRTEFLVETDESGRMAFRAKRVLDGAVWDALPAADGQLGSILRVYREWKLGAGDAFLAELWPRVRKAMEYAINTWDQNRDGLLEGRQHNTYDIEFYGLTSITNTIYFAALLAASQIAKAMGDDEQAARWHNLWETGSKLMDDALWNGEYYPQKVDEEVLKRYSYQYGKGCLSDQLLGQTLAHLYNLGYILPREHVVSAVSSIYKYNFMPSLAGHHSIQRNFAAQDEGGLVLCSWPHGGRPEQPMVYSDEVWTGIELQVATNLIYDGMIDEALNIVRAIRSRYDGVARSPYDEVECGYHYARAMAAWGLLVALSGYRFDIPAGEISFQPRIHEDDFTCFYSTGTSWGVYRRKKADEGVSESLVTLFGEEYSRLG